MYFSFQPHLSPQAFFPITLCIFLSVIPSNKLSLPYNRLFNGWPININFYDNLHLCLRLKSQLPIYTVASVVLSTFSYITENTLANVLVCLSSLNFSML